MSLPHDNHPFWRERYERLHKIHVEDVRRRKEVRRFRLANFSIAELEAELRRKKGQKPLPPRADWGALVMAALHLAGDAIEAMKRARLHIPKSEWERLRMSGARNSFYARHYRLTAKFKETRAREIARNNAKRGASDE